MLTTSYASLANGSGGSGGSRMGSSGALPVLPLLLLGLGHHRQQYVSDTSEDSGVLFAPWPSLK